jgi:hypothetical protein
MMKYIRALVLLFLCSAVLFIPAAYAGVIADREVLANGITLLHAEKTGLPIVTVAIAIKAGSIAEPAEKSGLNLTADLLTRGQRPSRRRSAMP